MDMRLHALSTWAGKLPHGKQSHPVSFRTIDLPMPVTRIPPGPCDPFACRLRPYARRAALNPCSKDLSWSNGTARAWPFAVPAGSTHDQGNSRQQDLDDLVSTVVYFAMKKIATGWHRIFAFPGPIFIELSLPGGHGLPHCLCPSTVPCAPVSPHIRWFWSWV